MTKIQSQLDRMLKSNGKISNTQGIKMAYDRGNKIFVKDNKMYIGGTTSFTNWLENFTKLPFGVLGGVRDMERYIEAERILKDNPQITELVGHSQAGVVALQLAKDFPNRNLSTKTYNSPVFSLGFDQPSEQHKRFRKVGDVVSAFDGSAINYNTDTLNPVKNHDISSLDNIDESIPERTLF